MNIEVIDLSTYPKFKELESFINAMKDFDVDKAIQRLTDNLVKDTENEASEYWHHTRNMNGDCFYLTNWDYEKCGLDVEKDIPIVGDWKYITFQSSEFLLNDTVREIFDPYKPYLKDFQYEVEIHSISDGARVPEHVDHPGISVGTSSVRNIVISLQYPKNVSPEITGVHIDRKAFTPEDVPMFMFDAQHLHSAWNHSTEPWILLVIYVPVSDLDL
jgi:hypothetical protein